MNVLLLGSGGREHAIAWAVAKSPLLGRLVVAPGNPGTASLGHNVAADITEPAAVVALARRHAIDLVVVGPEAPLVAGVADALVEAGIAVFGPSKAAAQLEGSKGFAKDFCRDFGIPTAAYARFDTADAALRYIDGSALPLVVKADGLASGKGVIIATTSAEAATAIRFMFDGGFGAAGTSVVIEAFLAGEEISFFALSDGTRALPLGSARDHKRVGDGDTGPNTGGMGAIAPAPALTAALEAEIMGRIIAPTLQGMRARNTPFRGLLFAGLMLTASGPQLIEFNVRFGDPETQAILRRLDEDLLALLAATATGGLPAGPLRFRPETGLAVVLAARGYPEAPLRGTTIRNLTAAEALPDVEIFHAGTRLAGNDLIADGGRVLTVTALGPDAEEARLRAYAAVDAIDWPEGLCRRDIGVTAIGPP